MSMSKKRKRVLILVVVGVLLASGGFAAYSLRRTRAFPC